MQLTLNVLFTLIVQAKIIGKGRTGNGRLFIRLLSILADGQNPELSRERNTLRLFTELTNKAEAYKKIDRLLFDFLPTGNGCPWDKIQLSSFEKKVNPSGKNNWEQYKIYLAAMGEFCAHSLAPDKLHALVHTLLQILRQDAQITSVFYGGQFLPKERLFGMPAHPVQLCPEALLLGILYQTMKDFSAENARHLKLIFPAEQAFILHILGDSKSPVFWDSITNLQRILSTETAVSLADQLRSRTAQYKPDDSALYPLRIRLHGEEIGVSALLSQNQRLLFLNGSGGIGKTTTLTQLQGENRFLLKLQSYQSLHKAEVYPETSCWILAHILLKYRYCGMYRTLESCIACEGEETVLRELSELQTLLRSAPNPAQPEYCLLLDGSNEVYANAFQNFIEELDHTVHDWHNVRILTAGRALPDEAVFSEFEQAELCGIPESLIDEILKKQEAFPTDQKLLELLRSPLFLQLYLQNANREPYSYNRGQILDAYIRNLRSPVHDKSRLCAFIVRFALPIAAIRRFHSYMQTVTRADLMDAADTAASLYLTNERIYQNYTVPQHFRRELLLNAMKNADIPELLTVHSGFLESDGAGQLRFTHQYFRDYFAARHYVNLLEVLSRCFDGRHISEIQDIFEHFDLGSVWFLGDAGDELYRLIGEICGDDRNTPDEEYYVFRRTVLDDFLDICRCCYHFRTVENIIRIMSLSRNGVICNVDFSGLSLPFDMPEDVFFSLNGLYPCDFSESRVLGVFSSSIPQEEKARLAGETVYPEEGCPQYYLNCDFTGAVFFPIPENREILRRYGAIVDEPDD